MDIDDIPLDDGTRPAFGKKWIRSHPFQIYAYSPRSSDYLLNPSTLTTYKNAMSAASIQAHEGTAAQKVALSEAGGLHFQAALSAAYDINYDTLPWINAVSNPSDDTAFYMGDEPYESALPGITRLASWLGQN